MLAKVCISSSSVLLVLAIHVTRSITIFVIAVINGVCVHFVMDYCTDCTVSNVFVLRIYISTYRVRINYRRISLRHNLRRKCRKIVKFVSITHSERNIWNGPIVATAISRKKRKPVQRPQTTPSAPGHPGHQT